MSGLREPNAEIVNELNLALMNQLAEAIGEEEWARVVGVGVVVEFGDAWSAACRDTVPDEQRDEYARALFAKAASMYEEPQEVLAA